MLIANQLSVALGGKPIIEDVSFSLKRGERLAIIGPNGSGKTTLLKTLAGLLPATGQLTYDAMDIRTYNPKQRAKLIGLMNQKPTTFFDHTVYDVVMMGRYVHAGTLSAQKEDEHIKSILELTGLSNHMYTPLSQLSGGMVQKVYLSAVIAQDTSIILLDEFTNHLDITSQINIIKFLKSFARDKILIGVFHDINVAMQMSDRLLLLDKGKVVIDAPYSQVLPLLNTTYQFNLSEFMISSLRKWDS